MFRIVEERIYTFQVTKVILEFLQDRTKKFSLTERLKSNRRFEFAGGIL